MEFLENRRFVVKLGKMLHKYGAPAFRLEAYLKEVADYCGVRSSFIVTPTSIVFVLWTDKHEDEYHHAARMDLEELDLGSLSMIDELTAEFLAGEITLAQADKRLNEINSMPSPYNKVITGSAFMIATGAFAMLMGASWSEIGWSSLLGIIAYFWTLWAKRSPRINLMLEPVTSFFAGLMACAISRYLDPGINIPLIVLSSIIIFIPGLSLCVGLSELSSRNLVSGTARIMDSIMQLFKLYFGTFLGISAGFGLFGENIYQPAESLPDWGQWLGVFLLSMGLVAVFRTRVKHIPWAILASFVAFGSTVWSSYYVTNGLDTFIGAFTLGTFANLFSRTLNQPSSIVALHGLILLVPGSKTYMGLNSFVSGQQVTNADSIGAEVFIIFMSLVAGLIFANVIAPTRRAL